MADTMPVWFITGCSTGFGRELAQAVLAKGYRAVVTARRPEDVRDIVAAHGERALALALDVTAPEQVREAVGQALAAFGQIDVLVNNAGIGYFSSLEEGDDAAVRRMFEINVFGLVDVTKAALPGMRARKRGTIVNLSSIGGLTAFPSLSYYNATKFAVEALSESLAQEVGPLGIKVLLVEPSGFRTDWAGRSADETPVQIADYEETVGARLRMSRANSGKQAGDPARAAQAIIAAVESPEPPLRLLLGEFALSAARAKLDALRRDFDAWEETTRGADAPLA